MPLPRDPGPRLFYRVAYRRLEEAETLRSAGYYSGSIYLAGYAVECMMKSLILATTPVTHHNRVISEFRGQIAHNFDWLRHRLSQNQALIRGRPITDSFLVVGSWGPDLRYEPGPGDPEEAFRFMAAVRIIVKVIDARLGN